MTPLREAEGIRYERYQPADLPEVAAVQAEAFTSGAEPVIGALQATREEFGELIRLLGPLIARDRLSVVARDASSGRIVGASLHLDMATENPPEVRLLAWFAPALALLEEMDRLYFERFGQGPHVEPGEILHFCWGAVAPGFQGRRIDGTMVDLGVEVGVAENYRAAVVEASGLASQHIFRKRGFIPRVEIPYRSYVYEGWHPFASVADEVASIILLARPLTT